MKTLSIKQPWASLICTPRPDNNLLGIKDIENRSWKTNFRGRILIHVSAEKVKFDNWYDSLLTNNQLLALPDEYCKCSFDYSAIIGEVDIVDCVINHPSIWAEKIQKKPFCRDCADEDGICPNSGKPCDEKPKPIWNWVLANPISYDTPILNVKGKLSFWEFTKPLNFKMKTDCNNCPKVFSTVGEAVRTLKLDRRHKWFEWMGQVVYNFKYTAPNSCTGCDGGGCFECGGTGKRVSHVPVPAFMPDGSIAKVEVTIKPI